jgi:hydrocephalus-inducing protein
MARNTPYHHRAKLLGDNYLSKLNTLGAKIEKQTGPLNTRLSKGKLDAKKVDSKNLKVGESVGNNVYVYDPDGIAAVTVPDTVMRVGAFTVSPYIGIIGPGQVAGVDITFDPSGCETVKEKLRFIVCGSDENDSSNQVEAVAGFDVVGDSCYPCIITVDKSSIFEEIEVVPSLTAFIESGTGTGTGTGTGIRIGTGVGAEMGTGTRTGMGTGIGDDEKHSRVPVGKVVFAEKENIMMWGAVMCSTGDTRGVAERIRITNPTKIDIKVKFKILTTEEAAEGNTSTSNVKVTGKEKETKTLKKEGKSSKVTVIPVAAESAFTVQPEVWDIPPHEHRYVTVYFNPLEIKNYRAVFAAEVADCSTLPAATPSTTTTTTTAAAAAAAAASTTLTVSRRRVVAGSGTSLMFDVGGTGTMPCISIEEPTHRQPDGSLLIDFQKVHVDRVCSRRFSLRNRGVMAATCLFNMTGSEDFQFSGRNTSLTLEPGQQEDLTVSFCPKHESEGKDMQAASVRVTVLHNHFDFYVLKLKGSSYECDAVIDVDNDNDSNSNSSSSMDREHNSDYSIVPINNSTVRRDEKESKRSDISYDISHEKFTFPEINLSKSPGNVCSTTRTLTLRSRSSHTLKYEFSIPDGEINA